MSWKQRTSKSNKIIQLIIVIFGSALLVSCNFKLFGTNTGNPEDPVPAMSPINSGTDYPGAYYFPFRICTKIVNCYPNQASFDNCITATKSTAGYTSEMGTTASSYATIDSLRSAEVNGTVTLNLTNATNCYQSIDALSCANNLVVNAYSTSAPNSYGSTKLLFQANSGCQIIY